ncbi:MAG: hypothetical protein H8E17_11475 [Deltaproteobacteria bacterium]|nr:hypothetical protein [Deltaproteobacteria bacterium]
MNKTLILILSVLLALFVVASGTIIITDGSDILANLGTHILRLFQEARLNPENSHGFSSFAQLIIIAVFVGWAINRFKKWRKK